MTALKSKYKIVSRDETQMVGLPLSPTLMTTFVLWG